jgi:TetR/AcrR family transcriptional regulator, transcriptional repressor of aconitase
MLAPHGIESWIVEHDLPLVHVGDALLDKHESHRHHLEYRMIILFALSMPAMPRNIQTEHAFSIIVRALPRVSSDYQALRRQHILRAARSCFSRLGFHATSMQDVLREAGVSAGALYCYFRGKDDIVAAIIDEVLTELTAGVEDLAARDNPPSITDVVEYLLGVFEHRDPTNELARLAVQVWAESLNDPGLATRLADRYRQVQDVLVRVLAKSSLQSQLPPNVPITSVAQVLVGLVPAYLLERTLLGDSEAIHFGVALSALLAERAQPGPTRQS